MNSNACKSVELNTIIMEFLLLHNRKLDSVDNFCITSLTIDLTNYNNSEWCRQDSRSFSKMSSLTIAPILRLTYVSGTLSNCGKVVSGVPQGSVLGYTLFLIHINYYYILILIIIVLLLLLRVFKTNLSLYIPGQTVHIYTKSFSGFYCEISADRFVELNALVFASCKKFMNATEASLKVYIVDEHYTFRDYQRVSILSV